MPKPSRSPLVLTILDGFGLTPAGPYNAITQARMPQWQSWWETMPRATLSASGEDVGLPDRLMGNSEVGHLNLGAGRIVYQEQTRITKAIREGTFFENPSLVAACAHARERGGALHLMGLVSDGGVHSHIDHVPAFLELAKRERVPRVFVHAFTDGRDTPPTSGRDFLARLERMLAEARVGRIASVIGRYYAMDRDRRWDRTARAWRALVLGEGEPARSAEEAIARSYARNETDEFVQPTVIVEAGQTVGRIRDGDAAIHFNFRPDRARQLTRALTQEDFHEFERLGRPRDLAFACLTRYDDGLDLPVAFRAQDIGNTMGELFSNWGLRQLRIAETEKYAHVTYFFSGGREEPRAGEERCLVPSLKVATYDLEPAMSSPAVTDQVVARLASQDFSLVVLNFANADMVGHTGNLQATIRGLEVLDTCLARVGKAVLAKHGLLVVTADHGNAEQMWDEARGEPHTAHTTNPVPLILVGTDLGGRKLEDGILADVAPTLLELLELPRPEEMTGRSLLR